MILLDENIGIDQEDEEMDISMKMLNSDQDSTSGEEDDSTIRIEDVHKLNPNYVLYRASALHNLPIMCQAIALGADKNWANVDENCRTPLHQAIVSGEFVIYDNEYEFVIRMKLPSLKFLSFRLCNGL